MVSANSLILGFVVFDWASSPALMSTVLAATTIAAICGSVTAATIAGGDIPTLIPAGPCVVNGAAAIETAAIASADEMLINRSFMFCIVPPDEWLSERDRNQCKVHRQRKSYFIDGIDVAPFLQLLLMSTNSYLR